MSITINAARHNEASYPQNRAAFEKEYHEFKNPEKDDSKLYKDFYLIYIENLADRKLSKDEKIILKKNFKYFMEHINTLKTTANFKLDLINFLPLGVVISKRGGRVVRVNIINTVP